MSNGASRGLAIQSVQQAISQGRVNIPGMVQTIWQPLYDYTTISSASSANQRFFQIPQGQAGKTILDTNMELAGQIPKGQAFSVTGIQVEVYPDLPITDAAFSDFANYVYDLYSGGALILEIGSKAFATQAPLMKFPPVNRLSLDSSVGDVAEAAAYISAAGREFATEPLLLESNQNFNVQLMGLALPDEEVDVRIGVTLNGFLHRNAQ